MTINAKIDVRKSLHDIRRDADIYIDSCIKCKYFISEQDFCDEYEFAQWDIGFCTHPSVYGENDSNGWGNLTTSCHEVCDERKERFRKS